jgi:hypothetical protein
MDGGRSLIVASASALWIALGGRYALLSSTLPRRSAAVQSSMPKRSSLTKLWRRLYWRLLPVFRARSRGKRTEDNRVLA